MVEMRRFKEGSGLADCLVTTLSEKLGDTFDPITNLGSTTVVEVIDLDPVATEAEVLEAIHGACRTPLTGPTTIRSESWNCGPGRAASSSRRLVSLREW